MIKRLDKIIRCADAFSDAISEYNALMNSLGNPIRTKKRTQNVPSSKSEYPGYQRIIKTPGQDLQGIAQQILMQQRGKPYGSSVPFTHDGTNYLAVLEEHDGGRVPGKHPGISLFVQRDTAKMPQNIASRNQKVIAGLNNKLQPLAARLVEIAAQQGIPIVLTTGYRSKAEQQQLYEQGRTTPGSIVTGLQGGKSKHNFGLAFDVAPLNDSGQPYWPEDEKLWSKIGEIGVSIGLRWGGNWPSAYRDRPHFELPMPSKTV